MAADLLQMLWDATLALTVALSLVLAVRVPLRRLGGATVLRWPWMAVVLAPLATLLPARELEPVVVQALQAPLVADAMPQAAADIAAVPADAALGAWLLAAWVIGAIACALACVWQQRRFERLLGRLQREDDGTWRAQSSVGTPALLGVLSPRIVLPADFDERFAPVERELALAHERAHRDGRDTWIAAVAATLRCVFWFHPLVHVAVRCLRLDLEYACDAAVLAAHPQRRRSYAEALVKAQPGPMLPLGCQWDAGRPLLARVRQLAAPLPGAGRRGAARGVAALLALLSATMAWALQPAVPADGEGRWIEAHVTLQPKADFGVAAPTAAEPARVVVRSGGTFSVRMGEDGAIWEVTGVPRFDDEGRIHLDVQLLRGGELEMSSSENALPGEQLALRSAVGADGMGATAKITVWPASGPVPQTDNTAVARATGRVQLSIDGKSETFFFDGGVGRDFETSLPGVDDILVHHVVTDVTPTNATIAFRVEQRKRDGTMLTLSTPTLVVERGVDGMVGLDVPAKDAAAEEQYVRVGSDAPVSAKRRAMQIRFTVDPA